jgi:hypothetical protein
MAGVTGRRSVRLLRSPLLLAFDPLALLNLQDGVFGNREDLAECLA